MSRGVTGREWVVRPYAVAAGMLCPSLCTLAFRPTCSGTALVWPVALWKPCRARLVSDGGRLLGGAGGAGAGEPEALAGAVVAAAKSISPLRAGRPGSARPAGGAAHSSPYLNASGPTAYSGPTQRRPTSAAGVGMRAYINTNLKAWRET